MNKKNKKHLLLPLLLLTSHCQIMATSLVGTSFFSPRSQSTNVARDLIGENRFEHVNKDYVYGVASATAEYTRSFRAYRLAQHYFGVDQLTITGSAVTGRSDDYILADYFGLSQNFISTVCLQPVMSNGIIDFSYFGGYKKWYWTAHLPLVWNKAKIDILETIQDAGINTPYPDDYMGDGQVNPAYHSFARAMAGGKTYGFVKPLEFGKIICDGASQTKLSEVYLTLGYDIVSTEYGHAGFNARVGIPSGTVPTSRLLFEPIVGNGHHWEFGLGFDSKALIWERDGTQYTYFLFVLNATHLFSTDQRRSFDFFNDRRNPYTGCTQSGFGSRYILVKEFDQDGNPTNAIQPAINISTLPCKVSIDVQFDLALMFSYINQGFQFDIGYNGWIRSKENICLNKSQIPNFRYAFKGIQNATNGITQSNATLDGNVLELAQSGALTFAAQQAVLADDPSPVFILPTDLNPDSAACAMMLTHKIFWYAAYAWKTCPFKYIMPYCGLGGEYEFEGIRPKWEQPHKNAMSQWGMWAKGGFAW